MFGRSKRRARYVVRKPTEAPRRYTVVTRRTKHVVFDSFEARDVFQGTANEAQAHARALNHQSAVEGRTNSYVFDALTGKTVYEHPSLKNCIDHAAFLNQDYTDTLRRAAEGRWFDVALSLVRTQSLRDAGDWVIRDTGFTFEVRTADGVLIAQCGTYADAANVKALADIAHGDILTPRAELQPPDA